MTATETIIIENVIKRLQSDPQLPPEMQVHLKALRPWLVPFIITPLSMVADESATSTRERKRQLEHARSLSK